MQVVQDGPGLAGIGRAQHAEIGASVDRCRNDGAVERERVERHVELLVERADDGRDVGPGRAADGGAKDMPGLARPHAVEAAEHGVDHSRVARVEAGADDAAAG